EALRGAEMLEDEIREAVGTVRGGGVGLGVGKERGRGRQGHQGERKIPQPKGQMEDVSPGSEEISAREVEDKPQSAIARSGDVGMDAFENLYSKGGNSEEDGVALDPDSSSSFHVRNASGPSLPSALASVPTSAVPRDFLLHLGDDDEEL